MDIRLTFNQDAAGYDRVRPTYTERLFSDVIAFSNLGIEKKALEIGIGTGQATMPFIQTGCSITAIELGDQLAEFTRDKFQAFPNIEVRCVDFERAELDSNTYDLIYSASAFHWIPPETGLPKVLRLLKTGGAFAWFSNQPLPADEHLHIHTAMQEVYGRYSQYFGGKKLLLDPEKKQKMRDEMFQGRIRLFEEYGFTDITNATYQGKRTFGAEDYTTLISTYSDHKAMPEEYRIPFLKAITETIQGCGGKFTLSDTMLLVMGRKP